MREQSLNSKIEDLTEQNANLREALAREQGVAKAAQERSNVLERQLQTAQDRLSAVQGASTASLVAEQDAAAKDLALERALTELESVKSQLRDAEEHAEQYRKIAHAAEQTVKQLMQKNKEREEQQASELEQARQELARQRAELDDKRTAFAEQMKELSTLQDAFRNEKEELNQRIAELTAQLEDKTAELENVQKRLQALNKEIESYQKSARAAHANYERELELHSAAAAALRAAEDARDQYRQAADAAEAKVRSDVHGRAGLDLMWRSLVHC